MEAVAMNTVLFGDVRETLRTLPAGLFHCVMTSPPYWNLRSYLKSDDPLKSLEIGSERTPAEFVETMVGVFREVRRVMRDDGVLWVNLGDSYAASPGQRKATDAHGSKQSTNNGSTQTGSASVEGLDGGNQCLMPHRVALAMQADGWILRSTVIWAKRSPMPESISGWRWVRCRVKTDGGNRGAEAWRTGASGHKPQQDHDGRDFAASSKWKPCPGCPKCLPHDGYVLRRGKWRCTTGHEYVFMFAKRERYFCDGDAVQEPCSPLTNSKGTNRHHKNGIPGVERQNGSFQDAIGAKMENRNPRSVWSLSSEPYKDAHFATFPTELARRCIAASTSKGGCCAECGAPYAPVVESERVPTRPGLDNQIDPADMANRDPQRHVARTTTTGYRPTCGCNAAIEPCRVLDPFGGSGTVGQVAYHLGCDYVLCELNRDYLPMIEERVKAVPRWKVKANGKPKRVPIAPDQLSLFP